MRTAAPSRSLEPEWCILAPPFGFHEGVQGPCYKPRLGHARGRYCPNPSITGDGSAEGLRRRGREVDVLPLEAMSMIDQSPVPAEPTTLDRDERSMRVMEYAMAILALVAALLLSIR
jgi:hypothetical protein